MVRLINNQDWNTTHGVVHTAVVAGVAARPMPGTEQTSPRWDRSISPITRAESELRADNRGNPQSQ